MTKTTLFQKIKLLTLLLITFAFLFVSCVSPTDDTSEQEEPKSSSFLGDNLPDGNGETVKVILLAGQSNASGVSYVACLQQKSTPEDYARYEKGYENIYINYIVDGGNNTSHGQFVPVGLGMGSATFCFGPELGIADYLSQVFPNEKIFIIKYSYGGSCLATQWFAPNGTSEGYLYSNFISHTVLCMNYLRAKNYNASIGALCWMQGEGDSFEPYSSLYFDNQNNFMSAVRCQLEDYAFESDICFIDAGISDSIYWVNYPLINATKKTLALSNPCSNKYFSTTDLHYDQEPSSDSPDLAHFDSLSELELGHRFGKEIEQFYLSKCSD